MDDTGKRRFYHANFQRYLFAGLLTITPLIAVWLVFDFFLNVLSAFGQPLAAPLTEFVDRTVPAAAPWLANPGLRLAIAVIVALLALYTIGAIASRVIGQRLIGLSSASSPASRWCRRSIRRRRSSSTCCSSVRAATSAWC